ncbi:MAG: response regulator [Gemmatimonadales bacterium]
MDHLAQVLLIEDEPLDRELVQELVALKGRGRIRITEAGDLSAGLALLASRAFDLVMLDTRLPEVSALSALRAVSEQAPHTPILPHPTFITPQVRHAARQRGAFDVATRGDLSAMWNALENLLSLAREARMANRVAS